MPIFLSPTRVSSQHPYCLLSIPQTGSPWPPPSTRQNKAMVTRTSWILSFVGLLTRNAIGPETPQNSASARIMLLLGAISPSFRRVSVGCSQSTLGCTVKVSLIMYMGPVIDVDGHHLLARVDKRSTVVRLRSLRFLNRET